jgi:hypothetical protein
MQLVASLCAGPRLLCVPTRCIAAACVLHGGSCLSVGVASKLHWCAPLQERQQLHDTLQELQQLGTGGRQHVLLLVCSRLELGYSLDGAPTVRLQRLPAPEAERLLRELGGSAVAWEPGQPERLVEVCCGNALLVTLLAGFICCGRISPKVPYRH